MGKLFSKRKKGDVIFYNEFVQNLNVNNQEKDIVVTEIQPDSVTSSESAHPETCDVIDELFDTPRNPIRTKAMLQPADVPRHGRSRCFLSGTAVSPPSKNIGNLIEKARKTPPRLISDYINIARGGGHAEMIKQSLWLL